MFLSFSLNKFAIFIAKFDKIGKKRELKCVFIDDNGHACYDPVANLVGSRVRPAIPGLERHIRVHHSAGQTSHQLSYGHINIKKTRREQ